MVLSKEKATERALEESIQQEIREEQEDLLLLDIDTIVEHYLEAEPEEFAQRYNFSFKPSVREHLRELTKYYHKSTDSGLLSEVIEQLYLKMKADEAKDNSESQF